MENKIVVNGKKNKFLSFKPGKFFFLIFLNNFITYSILCSRVVRIYFCKAKDYLAFKFAFFNFKANCKKRSGITGLAIFLKINKEYENKQYTWESAGGRNG